MEGDRDARSQFEEGLRRFRCGEFDAAEAFFRGALQIDPERGSVLTNLANTLLELGKIDEATLHAERATRLTSAGFEAWFTLARCRNRVGQYAAAIESFDRALAIRGPGSSPAHAQLWFGRGVALMGLGLDEEALSCFERSIAIDPQYAPAWGNCGVILKRKCRVEEALRCYERVIQLRPDMAKAWTNRGVALYDQRRYDEAQASYRQAQTCDPDDAEAYWNEAHILLLTGRFEEGWQKYSYRWWRHHADVPRYFHKPLEALEQATPGRRILLWAEQGYGDTIQFCRYAPLLARRGALVYIEAPEALRAPLSQLPGCRVLSKGQALLDFDFQAPFLDLPRIFATREDSIPSAAGYLRADAAKVDRWRPLLQTARSDQPRIAICCSGSAAHVSDHQRSMPLAEFAPLLDVAQVYLLQKELRDADDRFRAERGIAFLGERLESFADSAAIVQLMDLIVTVDTSLAHLAGALGKDVWILLPWAPEWRWLLDRTDSPWYSSARLFRQRRAGDWAGVMREVRAALSER